jgi:hypothetical protein
MSSFIGISLERAKKFWRSWGFVQLGDTDYFGWRRSAVPNPALQLPPSEGEKEDEDIAVDLETLFGGEGKTMPLRIFRHTFVLFAHRRVRALG